ncbi:hypothetical protein F511_04534 [Dorcoceras hygrometricum]|uniref:Uncharacterized protein n=1 Tax=Dorcoceras hygrometricum TaxID=472368 RepID=A0A2Z7BZQ5_9LAMI|nr:hypothetical protein F511_04534 [Dorcoceras hygrometricum]
MEQENKQVTQRLLTRRIEPSWKETSSEKRKPDREFWSSWMLMREMEEEMRRQESVIVNNVDAYDDVQTEDHMPSDTKGIMEKDSCGERRNQLGRKPAGKQAQSLANVQE